MLSPLNLCLKKAAWDYDNVILSPHISGGMEDYMIHATELFCENLKRYLNGKKLLNVIDKKKGY